MVQETATQAVDQEEQPLLGWPEATTEALADDTNARDLEGEVERLHHRVSSLSQTAEQREALLQEAWSDIQQREQRLQELRQTLRDRDGEVAHLQKQLGSALERYREALLRTAPDVPPDLVSGETVYELESSLERAREMVERIRSRIEERLSSERVPAGAPPRSNVEASRLSPMEKIRLALRRQPS